MKAIYLCVALGLSACGAKTTSGPTTADITPETLSPATSAGAYIIVQGKGYDAKDLGPYAAALPPIYAKYGGRYVAFSTDYDVAEGQSDYQTTIISAWPSADAARAFWTSSEYSEAKKLREDIGEFDVIIVPALPAK